MKTSVVGATVKAVDKSTCAGKSASSKNINEKAIKQEAAAEGETVAEEKAEKKKGTDTAQEDAEDMALKGRIGKQFKRRGSMKDPGDMAASIKDIKAKRAAKSAAKETNRAKTMM